MGLEEKRLQQDAQTKWVDEAKGYIEKYSGAKPEIEIDWATFDTKDSIMNMHYNGLGRVWEAVQGVATDDFAKSAIKDGLKKVTVKNIATGSQVSGKDGVLSLEGAFAKSEYPGVAEIKNALKGML